MLGRLIGLLFYVGLAGLALSIYRKFPRAFSMYTFGPGILIVRHPFRRRELMLEDMTSTVSGDVLWRVLRCRRTGTRATLYRPAPELAELDEALAAWPEAAGDTPFDITLPLTDDVTTIRPSAWLPIGLAVMAACVLAFGILAGITFGMQENWPMLALVMLVILLGAGGLRAALHIPRMIQLSRSVVIVKRWRNTVVLPRDASFSVKRLFDGSYKLRSGKKTALVPFGYWPGVDDLLATLGGWNEKAAAVLNEPPPYTVRFKLTTQTVVVALVMAGMAGFIIWRTADAFANSALPNSTDLLFAAVFLVIGVWLVAEFCRAPRKLVLREEGFDLVRVLGKKHLAKDSIVGVDIKPKAKPPCIQIERKARLRNFEIPLNIQDCEPQVVYRVLHRMYHPEDGAPD